MSSNPPTPRRHAGLRGFAAGFAAPWAGFSFMQQHPRLWRHAILPILCNLVLTALLLAGLAWAGVASYEWLESLLPSSGWWWVPVEILAGIAIVAVIIGLAIGGWLLFQGIFCGYFYSELARRVELLLGLKPEDIREVPLWYQVTDAVKDVLVLTAVAIGCLALSFVPVVGAFAAVAIGGYFDCFIFGMDYLDYPQALRARGRKVQRIFARRHRGATLGLGASVTLLTFVPVLSSVLLTTAAAGAVLLYRRLEADELAARGQV